MPRRINRMHAQHAIYFRTYPAGYEIDELGTFPGRPTTGSPGVR